MPCPALPTRRISAALIFVASSLSGLPAGAQPDWPQGQAIRFIVPFTAGSGTDIVARLLGEKLGPALGSWHCRDRNRLGCTFFLASGELSGTPTGGSAARQQTLRWR